MAGTLYVVATPIGNLEDLTFRALRILQSADLIAAEDTRRTAKLLAHYQIRTRMVSLHQHNEVRETPRLVRELTAGNSVALVSDAGTPGISDPGARLVQAARSAKITVVAVPGPSAVAAALSVSGFEASEFVFMGFPPRSGSERETWLSRLSEESRPVVFFEAPHRIKRTLTNLLELLGDKPILVCKELTKIHEYSVVAPISEVLESIPAKSDLVKGEFVLVMPLSGQVRSTRSERKAITEAIGLLTNNHRIEPDVAISIVSVASGKTEDEIRRAARKHLYSVK